MTEKPKILLIDDDPQIRRIIRMILEVDELQLFEADNGIHGLELAESQLPDLILLDIMMPVMDGYAVCARLRSLEATSKIPIIMVTALGNTREKVRGLIAGADDYLTKPFDSDELRARIAVQLRRKGKTVNIPINVFLCHSSNDKAIVRDLRFRLKNAGFSPWFDEENLLPGQDWQEEIPKAVRSSDVILVCLSKNAVQKSGYIQKEIRYALDAADEQPPGTIFVIPVKLEECDVPDRLSRWQWVNLFEDNGYERLLKALRKRADTLNR